MSGEGEFYCRVSTPAGASYGRLEGDRIRLLDGPGWAGGHPTNRVILRAGAQFLPPSEPRNILCLAGSYAGKEPVPPRRIRWFAKSAGAAATDGDAVEVPPIVTQLKTEAEVVIVVGRRLKNAGEDEAQAGIFGYAPGNELFGFPESFQAAHGEDPARPEVMLAAGLKLGDRFAPFGPFIRGGAGWVTRGRRLAITNPATGKKFESRSDTAGLLYSPARVLSELSQVLTLVPGDVVFTGADKSFVADIGDEITVEFEGLGGLTNRLVR